MNNLRLVGLTTILSFILGCCRQPSLSNYEAIFQFLGSRYAYYSGPEMLGIEFIAHTPLTNIYISVTERERMALLHELLARTSSMSSPQQNIQDQLCCGHMTFKFRDATVTCCLIESGNRVYVKQRKPSVLPLYSHDTLGSVTNIGQFLFAIESLSSQDVKRTLEMFNMFRGRETTLSGSLLGFPGMINVFYDGPIKMLDVSYNDSTNSIQRTK